MEKSTSPLLNNTISELGDLINSSTTRDLPRVAAIVWRARRQAEALLNCKRRAHEKVGRQQVPIFTSYDLAPEEHLVKTLALLHQLLVRALHESLNEQDEPTRILLPNW